MKTVNTTLLAEADEEQLYFSCNKDDNDQHSPSVPTFTFYYPRYTRSYEEITPNSEGGRKVWKSFEHYKAFRVSPRGYAGQLPIVANGESLLHWIEAASSNLRFAVGGFASNDNEVRPFGEPGLPLQGLPVFYDKRSDGGFIPPPPNLDDLERKALQAILPNVKAELSALNALYELKDFTSLPRTIAKIGEIGLHNRGRSHTLMQLLRGTADSYLQASFNILPFLSDLKGIQNSLKRTKSRIDGLLTRAGKPQRRHWATTWNEDDKDDLSDAYYANTSFHPYQQMCSYHLRRSLRRSQASFHVEIEYNYNYTQYQVANAQLLGMLDSLGINLNPAIIWNAIPWSFLVDWVFGVSRWLDQFKVQNMEPKINIRNYCWSIRRKRELLLWKTYLPFDSRFPSYPSGRSVPLPTVTEVSYRRHVTTPGVSSIISSGLSLREFSLGAALVLPRRWTPKPR